MMPIDTSSTRPPDWDEVTVDELKGPTANSMSTGPFGSSIGSRFFRPNGVPVIRGGNLSADTRIRLSDADLVFISEDKAAEFERSTVRDGDLIFTCWGTVNQIGLIDDSSAYSHYVISNKQMKLTPDRGRVDSEFLYYLFSGPGLQQKILDGSIGTSIPGFNLTQLKAIRLAIPRLPEQRAIAAALSDVDGLIGVLEQLIVKKRAIKQAAMQRSLTGRTRLPGFGDEWESTILGDIASVLKGSGLSKSVAGESGSRKCVLYGELFTTYGSHIDEVFSRTDSEGGRPSHAGDVLMPGSTTTIGVDLAKASALLEDGAAIGGDINIIRPHSNAGVCSAFLADYLTEVKKAEIAERTQGITIIHLYGRDLLNLRLELPPFAEQQAIATVLSDMDTEIAALERRRNKTKAIKQGMMQELLTGRTRLV